MTDDQGEDDLFAREMAGVRRLRAEPSVRLRKPTASRSRAAMERRRRMAEQADAGTPVDGLNDSHIEWVGPHDIIEWRGDGIAHGVFRRLKQGGYRVDANLDLHRHTVEQARRALIRFILDCQKMDVRTAVIQHGKGDKVAPGERQAVLKSYTNHWLRLMPQVLAFHSTQPWHGGAGALYVLVKKSEQKKLENRERYRAL